MPTLIQNLGIVGEPAPERPEYLKDFDPDWTPEQGAQPGVTGLAVWTHDKAEAKQFPGFSDAMVEWRRPSLRMPIRRDGQPNRPLSAYSVTFVQVEE